MQVVVPTFFMVTPNKHGSSVRTLPRVTTRASRNLTGLLKPRKILHPSLCHYKRAVKDLILSQWNLVQRIHRMPCATFGDVPDPGFSRQSL